MLISPEKSLTLETIRVFNRLMINSINNNYNFEFENKHYFTSSDGVCVQTLIDNRILYRIYLEENKNKDFLTNDLLEYLQNYMN